MHYGLAANHPLLALLATILVIVPFWRICAKAGYSGWISLLLLVPIANLLLLYFLGFSEWPLERHVPQTGLPPGPA